MVAVDEKRGKMFKLMKGFSSETSGGLLVALPKENAAKFVADLVEADGQPAWIVGDVVAGSHKAFINDDARVLEV